MDFYRIIVDGLNAESVYDAVVIAENGFDFIIIKFLAAQ